MLGLVHLANCAQMSTVICELMVFYEKFEILENSDCSKPILIQVCPVPELFTRNAYVASLLSYKGVLDLIVQYSGKQSENEQPSSVVEHCLPSTLAL
ncbi:hypothetical protein L6452_19409 [Arctium lappa]|uniref:Uncharacterized protein n=1 Tax=Arctium lappa TaxID=4217 RepID=A0ACB9B8L1_ARCLA|nr:hypothetical protein L6452_19409 [Arctium lappa]